ncbi:KilA-N domain-containing protein [Vitreoscilla massiliensis]|uniref:KilA-N domain-containing protein n=1 Tax=Vitreoscilla massiliensis TaxID=1689272 RepID=A0ABY4DZY4_9NEIS|nr:KilA-N domain-containing protein [Vitreoscilla massiliensis]UOO88862.1 KilA-N domain-containing protein [Vitreoscilla massiliensis]
MSKFNIMVYQGHEISADNKGWINATMMATPFGKRTENYLRNEQTKRYIAALAQKLSVTRKSVSKQIQLVRVVKGGNEQGTWLHPKLAIDFARWLSPEFGVWCDEQIEGILNNVTIWNQEREMVKAIQGVFTDTMKALAESKGTPAKWYDYKNECCRINRALTGKWDKLERDGLSKPQLKIIREMVAYDIALLSQNKTTEEREQLLAAKAFALCGGQLLEVQA